MVRGEIVATQAESLDVTAAIDLRRALLRLSHDDRLVIVLRYYLDMRQAFRQAMTVLDADIASISNG